MRVLREYAKNLDFVHPCDFVLLLYRMALLVGKKRTFLHATGDVVSMKKLRSCYNLSIFPHENKVKNAMTTRMIEVAIPDELQPMFAERLKTYGGDSSRYVQEVVAKDLNEMQDPARQSEIDATFDAIHRKYGEALSNLAK